MEARPWRGDLPAAMDLAHAPAFALGPLTVEPALRKVSAVGRSEVLEPRTMRVLVALALLYIPKFFQEYILHYRQLQPWGWFRDTFLR